MLSYINTFAIFISLLVQNNDPTIKLHNGLTLSINGQYEESELILKAITDKDVVRHNLYHFTRLLNNFSINNKDEAQKHAKAIEDSFKDDLPLRYKTLAYMMTEDLKHWKSNDLKDIGRDMKMSSDRLANSQGGKTTQKIQKDIIDKLDTFIKEQEDKNNNKNKSAKSKKGDGKKEGDEKEDDGKVPGQNQNKNQDQPAQDSNIMNGNGTGRVEEKKLRHLAENWGKMPPSKRAEAVQEITRDLPPKYKPMIEEYFKSLNKIRR